MGWPLDSPEQSGGQIDGHQIQNPAYDQLQLALTVFRKNEGWKVGVDGSVALVEWGVGENINTIDIKDPIVGFVFGNKGLMYNLTIEGSKFTKIDR